MPANESCKGCIFFNPMDGKEQGGTPVGECRRHPPAKVAVLGGAQINSQFPGVRENQWCGEWQPKPGSTVRTSSDAPTSIIEAGIDIWGTIESMQIGILWMDPFWVAGCEELNPYTRARWAEDALDTPERYGLGSTPREAVLSMLNKILKVGDDGPKKEPPAE